MSAPDKKYGLFIPRNLKKSDVKSVNIFDDDDDDDESSHQTSVKKGVTSKYGNTSNSKNVIKRQTQLDIDKALAEDPNAFEYDNVYDDMLGKKEEKTKSKKVVENKPKYIEQLLKMNEMRQKEEERRQERKIQKEREAEGDEFADKEVFVTSAYKKKMEERQAEEEREKREAALEAKQDVTKQKDMTGFYRYLLHEKTKDVSKTEDDSKDEKPVKSESDSDEKVKQKTRIQADKEASDSESGLEQVHKTSKNVRPEKQYRKRKNSENSDDSDENDRHRRKRSRSADKTSRSDYKRTRSPEYRHDKYNESDRKKGCERDSREKHNKSRSRDHSSRKESKNKIASQRSRSRSRERRNERSRSAERSNNKHSRRHEKPSSKDRVSQIESTKNKHTDTVKPAVDNGKVEPAEQKSKYARKSTESDLKDARARYLHRKLATERMRPIGPVGDT